MGATNAHHRPLVSGVEIPSGWTEGICPSFCHLGP